MARTYTLCRLFGVEIRMHVSFLVLPLCFGWIYGARGLFVVGFVFTCVTFHELSHAVQARRCGLVVREITLYPIGGVANVQAFGHDPAQEWRTAIAGPLFNFISAALLYLPMRQWLGVSTLWHRDVIWQMSLDTWPKTFASCFWINPLLGVFNLLPAFPMDGGRILRSVLAQRLDYARATRIAVTLGRFLAILLGLLGLLSSPPHLLLIAIAVFIYMAASQEATVVAVRSALEPFRVSDIASRQYLALSAEATTAQVLDVLLRTPENEVPVMEGESLLGFLPRAEVIRAVRERRMDVPVRALVQRDVPALAPDDSLLAAYQAMEHSGYRTLPVMRAGQLLGVISFSDVSRVYAMMESPRR